MTHHVLLIGIDAYDGTNPLNGCVNDIDGIQQVLLERLKIPASSIHRLAAPRSDSQHPTTVPERLPTLANIQAELRYLAEKDYTPDDRVFIYYSGHGTQVPVEMVIDGQKRSFPREALVPKDHYRAPDRQYLFDFEINEWLGKIASRTRSVSFVLDACCSAGATRDALQPARSAARFHQTLERYVPPPGFGLGAPRPGSLAKGTAATVSDCQIVTACRDDEKALEQDAGGQMHGALSRALLAELKLLNDQEDLNALVWGRLWRSVVAAVQATSPAQSPQMFGTLARLVFGGPPEVGDSGYAVVRDGGQYRLDAGTLSGVTEQAEIAVYGVEPKVFPPLPSTAGQVARLRVLNARRSSAVAELIEGPAEPPPGARGRLVKAGKEARLVVSAPADAPFRADLDSPLLRLAEPGDQPDVWVVRRDDGSWELEDDLHGSNKPGDRATLVVLRPAHVRAGRARPVLEHYFRYSLPFRMARLCQDVPNALSIELLDCNGFTGHYPRDQAAAPALPALSRDLQGGYSLKAGTGGGKKPDRVAMRLSNLSKLRLQVSLFGCMGSGNVVLLTTRVLNPNEISVVWAEEDVGLPFVPTLDEGQKLIVDRLVAIGTTRQGVSLAHLVVNEGFNEILEPTRGGLKGDRPPGEPPEQWVSEACVLRSRDA